MQRTRYRGKRPSRESVERAIKEGVFHSPGWYTVEERESQLRGVVEELEALQKVFPRTQNLEYAVLKCHLVLERILSLYIQSHAKVDVELDELRFSFKQKLDVAYLMGFGAIRPDMLPFYDLINRARNEVAHKFGLNVKHVDEAIRIAAAGDEDSVCANDRQRIAALRRISAFYCGVTAGMLEGEFAVVFGDEMFGADEK